MLKHLVRSFSIQAAAKPQLKMSQNVTRTHQENSRYHLDSLRRAIIRQDREAALHSYLRFTSSAQVVMPRDVYDSLLALLAKVNVSLPGMKRYILKLWLDISRGYEACGYEKTPEFYTNALVVYRKLGFFQTLNESIQEMESRGMKIPRNIDVLRISTLCASGQIPLAENRMRQVLQYNLNYPVALKQEAFNSVFKAYADRRWHQDVDRLWNETFDLGIARDRLTYFVYIHSHVERDQAYQLVRDMEVQGVKVQIQHVNQILRGFVAAKQYDKASSLFQAIKSMEFPPAVSTYDHMLQMHADRDDPVALLKMYFEMCQAVRPYERTSVLIGEIFHRKHHRSIQALENIVQAAGSKLSEGLVKVIMRGYSQAINRKYIYDFHFKNGTNRFGKEDLDEYVPLGHDVKLFHPEDIKDMKEYAEAAYELFTFYLKKCDTEPEKFSGNSVIFSRYMQILALSLHKSDQIALLIDEVIRKKVYVTPGFFNHALHVASRLKSKDLAHRVFKSMDLVHTKCTPTYITYNLYLQALLPVEPLKVGQEIPPDILRVLTLFANDAYKVQYGSMRFRTLKYFIKQVAPEQPTFNDALADAVRLLKRGNLRVVIKDFDTDGSDDVKRNLIKYESSLHSAHGSLAHGEGKSSLQAIEEILLSLPVA